MTRLGGEVHSRHFSDYSFHSGRLKQEQATGLFISYVH